MRRVAFASSKDQDSSKKKPIIIYFKDLFCRLRSIAYSYLCWPTKILEIACRLWVTNSLVISLGPLHIFIYVQILVIRLYVNSLFSDEDVTKPWGGSVSHAV